jgi:hypothetical protein
MNGQNKDTKDIRIKMSRKEGNGVIQNKMIQLCIEDIRKKGKVARNQRGKTVG